MTIQILFYLCRLSFLSSLSSLLKQLMVSQTTGLGICSSYDFYINSILYDLIYELNVRLRKQLVSLHLWDCTSSLPCVLQGCLYIQPVQKHAAFKVPKINGQSSVNTIPEMLLFAQVLTTFQVAALIQSLHYRDENSRTQALRIHLSSDFLAAKTLNYQLASTLSSLISQLGGTGCMVFI